MESVASGAAAEAAGWIPDLSLAASCQRVCLQNRNMCIERKKTHPLTELPVYVLLYAAVIRI